MIVYITRTFTRTFNTEDEPNNEVAELFVNLLSSIARGSTTGPAPATSWCVSAKNQEGARLPC